VGAHYNGNRERVRRVETPHGPVRIAGLEDLIATRLISSRYWQRPDDFDQAVLLVAQHRDDLDWTYLEASARREEVVELLPLLRERANAVAPP